MGASWYATGTSRIDPLAAARAIQDADGNISAAARALGLRADTLHVWLVRHDRAHELRAHAARLRLATGASATGRPVAPCERAAVLAAWQARPSVRGVGQALGCGHQRARRLLLLAGVALAPAPTRAGA